MPRNFHRRVETLIPIEDPSLRTRLIELLQLQIADNVKSWLLKPDGKYERVQLKPGQAALPRAGALHRDDARPRQDRRGERDDAAASRSAASRARESSTRSPARGGARGATRARPRRRLRDAMSDPRDARPCRERRRRAARLLPAHRAAIAPAACRVSDVHELYFEESGNPRGKPIVFLHGGPGFGTEPSHRRFFDPAAYRIVLFDQRGCGKSTPHASLVDNTTWHLVADIEALRHHLGIERWHVFGGSWGSTLALAYAETHPERVTALVLRGIFLVRKQEIDWFYQRGAGAIFPDAWEKYVAPIPPSERADLVSAFYRRLTSDDRERAPARGEGVEHLGGVDELPVPERRPHRQDRGRRLRRRLRADRVPLLHARRVARAAARSARRTSARIRHIPAVIVQGRYDVVCPMESAWALHRAWPEADFRVVPGRGARGERAGNAARAVEATDRLR